MARCRFASWTSERGKWFWFSLSSRIWQGHGRGYDITWGLFSIVAHKQMRVTVWPRSQKTELESDEHFFEIAKLVWKVKRSELYRQGRNTQHRIMKTYVVNHRQAYKEVVKAIYSIWLDDLIDLPKSGKAAPISFHLVLQIAMLRFRSHPDTPSISF